MTTPSPSLKSRNLKWLALLVTVDALLMSWMSMTGTVTLTWSPEVIERVTTGVIAPVAVLLLVNVLPHDVKAMLVYWRGIGVLPGAEAFTRYGPRDSRIDMAQLQRNIGVLPASAKDQNTKWYQLYKQATDEPEVSEAHRLYLMYRDMAVLSLVLLLSAPVLLWVAGVYRVAVGWTVALLLGQYIVTALSARWSGVRLVCNVLAVHSARQKRKSR
jgi:hypothetical protein